MASSSSRDTHLERHLFSLFQTSFTYLSEGGLVREARHLVGLFSQLLDMESWQLEAAVQPDALSPPYTAGIDKGEPDEAEKRAKAKDRATRDDQFWIECEDYARKHKESGNVWNAGNELGKVGQALFKAGRDREAKRWCERGEELHTRAIELLREEEKREKWMAESRGGGRRYSHGRQGGERAQSDDGVHRDRGDKGLDLSGFS